MSNLDMVVLNRKQLYDEIWKLSASGVAKKYNLHYGKLINSLKENNIPYPSSGYWTRLACGKNVSGEIIPLPKAEMEDIYLYPVNYSSLKAKRQKDKSGVATQKVNVIDNIKDETFILEKDSKDTVDIPDTVLSFLDNDERQNVINVLENIQVKSNSKLHPVLAIYKKSIEEWKKQERENKYIKKRYYDYNRGKTIEQPVFMDTVSSAGLNRVIYILDILYKEIEKLGGRINNDLSMKIRGETVKLSFAEGQDKKVHELTKQEAKELLEYKEKVRFNQYASKPQIRKYDYYYNGKLRLKFSNGKYLRDNEQQRLEDRIDEIIVELYAISENYRIEREKREEQH